MATNVRSLIENSLNSTSKLFKGAPLSYSQTALTSDQQKSERIKIATKISDEYGHVMMLPPPTQAKPTPQAATPSPAKASADEVIIEQISETEANALVDQTVNKLKRKREQMEDTGSALTLYSGSTTASASSSSSNGIDQALVLMDKRRRLEESQKPQWHAPWKLKRVISGHMGWVRTIAVDPSNEWFATGSTDRTIKIWDLATGVLKTSFLGHINTVRAIAISDRSPYMFSVGEDKSVKCWDLEQNKTIRSYHGHLNGVYCCCLHPKLDLLFTGGRDSTVRVWDIRTKTQIFALTGHNETVASVVAQATDPQVISGSMDSQVRCWDLIAGKTRVTLTNHKKAVRALLVHPTEYTFASASANNIKKWKCPEAQFLQNYTIPSNNFQQATVINAIDINQDNVMVSGSDDGKLHFWDWKTGYNFHHTNTIPQPGSLDSEAGIFATKFDLTGTRLITGEADKTIKIWCEDEEATEETHPITYEVDEKPKKY